MKLKARIKELESAISTTVEDLCLRAERASDSDVAQMLWGIAEDLEKAALEQKEKPLGAVFLAAIYDDLDDLYET